MKRNKKQNLKNQKKKNNLFDIINFIFVIFVLITFLLVSPYLLIQEYKNNIEFEKWLLCEESINKKIGLDIDKNPIIINNSCNEIKKLSENANLILFITMMFWFGVIIEKDIYPNKKKIKKWLDDHYTN